MATPEPYIITVVDRSGSPYEVARAATPIEAFKVAESHHRHGSQVALVSHEDREEWLGEDAEIERWLNEMPIDGLREVLRGLAPAAQVADETSRDQLTEAIYEALYPCKTCGGAGYVIVGGPDSFGNYDADECPDCVGRLADDPRDAEVEARITGKDGQPIFIVREPDEPVLYVVYEGGERRGQFETEDAARSFAWKLRGA